MSTFVRVAEIWVPDADGYLLEFGGGLYAQAPEFGALSRAMCFGKGEGLPGRVWESGRPVVMPDLQAGHFQRAAAAKAAGLASAIAFPVVVETRLKAVVVLFCGDRAAQSGAIEVWHNDARGSNDLTLADAVYGGADAAFEQASRALSLPRGTGLPGAAWQAQGAVMIDSLADGPLFVRGEAAGATALRSGLAFPCGVAGDEVFVLALLSAPDVPVATRIECWKAGPDERSLVLASALGATPPHEAGQGGPSPAILQAFATGVPCIGGGAATARVAGAAGSMADGDTYDAATNAATDAAIVLPIAVDGVVTEAVALYFPAGDR